MVYTRRFQGGDIYINPEILSLCIKSCGLIEETNNIYLFMYKGSVEKFKLFFGNDYVEMSLGEYSMNDDNIAIYYKDIENPNIIKIIPEVKQDEFEKTHTIVMGKQSIINFDDRYYNLRSEFFNACIKQDQNEAIKLVLQKYGKNE